MTAFFQEIIWVFLSTSDNFEGIYCNVLFVYPLTDRFRSQYLLLWGAYDLMVFSSLKFWSDCRDRSHNSDSRHIMQKRGICERSRLGLSQLDYWHDKQRTQLQDGDHSGNDPRLVPAFPRQCSGMFRRMSVFVGSGEIRLTWTVHPKCGTLS